MCGCAETVKQMFEPTETIADICKHMCSSKHTEHGAAAGRILTLCLCKTVPAIYIMMYTLLYARLHYWCCVYIEHCTNPVERDWKYYWVLYITTEHYTVLYCMILGAHTITYYTHDHSTVVYSMILGAHTITYYTHNHSTVVYSMILGAHTITYYTHDHSTVVYSMILGAYISDI